MAWRGSGLQLGVNRHDSGHRAFAAFGLVDYRDPRPLRAPPATGASFRLGAVSDCPTAARCVEDVVGTGRLATTADAVDLSNLGPQSYS